MAAGFHFVSNTNTNFEVRCSRLEELYVHNDSNSDVGKEGARRTIPPFESGGIVYVAPPHFLEQNGVV